MAGGSDSRGEAAARPPGLVYGGRHSGIYLGKVSTRLRAVARGAGVRIRERGFTLVEIIVALTILAMTILLVSRAFLILLSVTNKGGNQTVASALAVRVLEQVRSGPESQSNSAAWMSAFDTNVAAQGPVSFAAPYTNYAYQVVINQVDLTPSTAYACWLTSAPPPPCTVSPDHSNTMKWVTVRVTFRGQPLAQVSSAVIRDMYHRP